MKAIAVIPGKPNTVHLAELPKPTVDEVPNGRGVLVRVLRVGVDGTERRSTPPSTAMRRRVRLFGRRPRKLRPGRSGGPNVIEVKPGDYVVATVRRPGSSIYDLIGTNE